MSAASSFTLSTSLRKARSRRMNDLPLGRDTGYPDRYAPDLLFPVVRAEGRQSIGLAASLPFHGADLWTAYELTWLSPSGRPEVAVLHLTVPAESPRLIESKSLKLYLGSFAMSSFDSAAALRDTLAKDLSDAAGADVAVQLQHARDSTAAGIAHWSATCIDYADVTCDADTVDAGLLQTDDQTVTDALQSHVLRSLCPVTGQPDTGSVLVKYRGPRIRPESLLRYVASFRNHNDFHELCVERMFVDLKSQCQAERLTVYARYNRRGGIDINPFRSDFERAPPAGRLWRQ